MTDMEGFHSRPRGLSRPSRLTGQQNPPLYGRGAQRDGYTFMVPKDPRDGLQKFFAGYVPFGSLPELGRRNRWGKAGDKRGEVIPSRVLCWAPRLGCVSWKGPDVWTADTNVSPALNVAHLALVDVAIDILPPPPPSHAAAGGWKDQRFFIRPVTHRLGAAIGWMGEEMVFTNAILKKIMLTAVSVSIQGLDWVGHCGIRRDKRFTHGRRSTWRSRTAVANIH